MFGKNPRVNPLELRKQLLVAESEINRNLLIEDAAALTSGVRTLTERARSVGSLVSSAATLVMGLMAARRSKTPESGAKPSWFRTLLRGLGLVSTIWMAYRSTSARDPGSG